MLCVTGVWSALPGFPLTRRSLQRRIGPLRPGFDSASDIRLPLSVWSLEDAHGTGPASPRVWGPERPARAALVFTVREGAPSCRPGPLSHACPETASKVGGSHPADPGLGDDGPAGSAVVKRAPGAALGQLSRLGGAPAHGLGLWVRSSVEDWLTAPASLLPSLCPAPFAR